MNQILAWSTSGTLCGLEQVLFCLGSQTGIMAGMTVLTGVVPLAWMENFVCEQVFAGWIPRKNLWEPFISCSPGAVGLRTLTQH